jgi:hypothetical protein
MKTTERSKMLLALAAMTAVTLFLAAPSFGDQRDRDGGGGKGGHVVWNGDRDRGHDSGRDWDGNRNQDRKWNSDGRYGSGPTHQYRPAVYCAPVRVVPEYRRPVVVGPPVVFCRPVPVRSFLTFWFCW